MTLHFRRSPVLSRACLYVVRNVLLSDQPDVAELAAESAGATEFSDARLVNAETLGGLLGC